MNETDTVIKEGNGQTLLEQENTDDTLSRISEAAERESRRFTSSFS